MKKYVVYSPMRTGSTLYCRVLDLYHQHLYGTENNVFWEDAFNYNNIDYSTEHAIYHLHNVKAFSQAPTSFTKVLTTRNIFESVISLYMVKVTNTWHVHTKKEKKRYYKSLLNQKYTIDTSWFKHRLHHFDDHYKIASNVLSKTSIILDYRDHALNIKNLCDRFDITTIISKQIRANPFISDGGTRLVDKFSLIDNLQELVDIYQTENITFRYDERRTLSHIKRTYLRTR